MLAGSTSHRGQLSPACGPLELGGKKAKEKLIARIPPHCWKDSFKSLHSTDSRSAFALLTVTFLEKLFFPCAQLRISAISWDSPLLFWAVLRPEETWAHTAKPAP